MLLKMLIAKSQFNKGVKINFKTAKKASCLKHFREIIDSIGMK